MKKTAFFLSVIFLLSFTHKPSSNGIDALVIIQFQNRDFEKNMSEILTGFKSIKGIVYLSHCDEKGLFVAGFSTQHAGNAPFEKYVRANMPPHLIYDLKDATLAQINSNFNTCLTIENLAK